MPLYFEDMIVGSVARFGAYAVSAGDIKSFAREFDPQPFHLDEDAGPASAMGIFCASGWHTAAIAMRLLVDEQMAKDMQGMGSPGVDSLRWLRPVLPGDILSLETEVLEALLSRSKPDRGLVKTRVTVLNQQAEPVMTMVANAFYRCRSS